MAHSTDREAQQTSFSQSRQANETLTFHGASSTSPNKPSQTREHIVPRHWDRQDGLEQSLADRQQEWSSTRYTGMSAMQRWQAESSKEQPYNNIGSYMTKTVEPTKTTETVNENRRYHAGDYGYRD
ncbi:MAG: hypothetical protein M1836_006443 [Candelina mexicana]|nr:MAG: hypothetical protein M1836_006443 [Candelina mexicana]